MRYFLICLLVYACTWDCIAQKSPQPGTKEWKATNIANGVILGPPPESENKGVEYYLNGKIKMEGPLVEAYIIDTVTLYDRYGVEKGDTIIRETKEVKDGRWILYDPQGNKIATILFRLGVPKDTTAYSGE